MKKQLMKYLAYIVILINTLVAQFIEFDSNIDLRQIRENERFYFENAQEDINNFFNISVFGTDITDLNIKGTLHIMIESIIEIDNQKILNGHTIITNRNDIIMILKSFSFPIIELKNISYNPNHFNSLSSLLEFGAYILIANELDTYEMNGGNKYYNMARDIASDGKESDYLNGWNERWKKCKEIQENVFLRNTKYYFFYTYEDSLNQKDRDFKEHVYLFHESIKSNSDFIGIDNNTKNFLNAYCNDIADYYLKVEFEEGLEYLINYDIDNKQIYQEAIDMLR